VPTYVLGAFNPGFARLPNGNLLLMVRVAEALLVREILDGNEVMELIKGHELPPLVSPKDSADHTQQVLRPESGRRVPGLSEGSQPA